MSTFDPKIFFSTLTISALAFAIFETKPSGNVDQQSILEIKPSSLTDAGLGVFVIENCQKGTVLGQYPGRIWADHSWLKFKGTPEIHARARKYIWRLDNGIVIDPTNAEGLLEETVPWTLPFGLRLPLPGVPTVLARINEPSRLGDTNVCTEERDGSLLFVLERTVFAGEELFLDYGPHYDRTGYHSGGLNTYVDS